MAYGRRMNRGVDPLITGAALARVDEMRGSDDDRELKAAERAMWALGDYHRFATETVWGLGPELVEACGIAAGQRVLDVAAGAGLAPSRVEVLGREV